METNSQIFPRYKQRKMKLVGINSFENNNSRSIYKIT